MVGWIVLVCFEILVGISSLKQMFGGYAIDTPHVFGHVNAI